MATPKQPGKKPSRSDLKPAVIILLLLAAGVFFFLMKSRQHTTVPQVKKPQIEKVVKPAPAKVIPVAVPAVKKYPVGKGEKIAFILDDWGYTMRNCKYLQEIKAPLAVAILPNLRYSDKIAQCASGSGKTVMLHLPLEPYQNNDKYPDNYLITTTMKPAQVVKLLEDTLGKMPLVQGVNNHMGSKATEDKALMQVIFKHLKKHGLFFVDSMTSPHHSVCGELADRMDLAFAQRDVFLDNINTRVEIKKQMVLLAEKARKKGYAVAIGHDRELTLKVLAEEIPVLQAQGFEIVSVKTLVRKK